MSNFPTENEMITATEVWRRMQDAVIEGSKLSQSFAELQTEVGKLRQDLEFLRERNGVLDEHIRIARGQRDEVQTQLEHVRVERAALITERNEVTNALAISTSELAQVYAELTQWKKNYSTKEQELSTAVSERDQYKFQWDDALSLAIEKNRYIEELEAKLAKAKTDLDEAFFRNLEIAEDRDYFRAKLDAVRIALGHPIGMPAVEAQEDQKPAELIPGPLAGGSASGQDGSEANPTGVPIPDSAA